MTRSSTSLILICLLSLAGPAGATQYNVSPDGNDFSDGSAAKPFKHIFKALENLSPGDEVIIHAGQYRETLRLKSVRGTKEKPIVIRAAAGQLVVITALPKARYAMSLDDCEYIVIRHLEFQGPAAIGIGLPNSDHCLIEGNVIHGFTSRGIHLINSSDNIIRGNTCYYNNNGIAAIQESNNNLIEGNICAFNNKSSENADGICVTDSTKNTLRFNIIAANNDDGLDTWTSTHNLIEYNYSCANGDRKKGDGNGFKLGGRWSDRESNWLGGHNTLRNNVSAWNRGVGFTDNGSKGNRYEGNVAYGNRSQSAYASVKHTAPATADSICEKIRGHFSKLIAAGVLRPNLHTLPPEMGLLNELPCWPKKSRE